jgi:hypothetical protein
MVIRGLGDEADRQLQETLKAHRKNRPVPEE